VHNKFNRLNYFQIDIVELLITIINFSFCSINAINNNEYCTDYEVIWVIELLLGVSVGETVYAIFTWIIDGNR